MTVATISVNSIFILYLIISSNFLAPLFGCQIQELLSKKMWVKHIFGFFTFYFFIALTNSDLKNDPLYALFISFGIYILFMMSTRLDIKLWYVVFSMLILAYLIVIFEPKIKEERKESISKFYNGLSILIILIIMLGFIYSFKHEKESIEVSFKNFIIGSPICEIKK